MCYLVIGALSLFILAVHTYRIVRVNNKPLWGDAFTYLRIAREIARCRCIPDRLSFFRIGKDEVDRFTLPPLLMLLLAPFSRLPYRVMIQTSFLFDLLIAVMCFLTARLILHCTATQAAFASLIYLLTPITCFTTTSLTPRPLGLLFFLLFSVSVAFCLETGSWSAFFLAVASVTFLLLSQRMVVQIVFLVSPLVVGFLEISSHTGAVILFSIVLGITGALLLTKGRYFVIIVDHFRRVLVHVRFGDQAAFKKKLGNPLEIIKANPWLLLLPLLLWQHGAFDYLSLIMLGYTMGVLILAEFWVFGNGINHIYFASPLVALLLVKNLQIGTEIAALMLCIGTASFYLVLRRYRVVADRRAISQDWLDCFAFINASRLEGTIMVVPSVACSPIVYYTGLNLLSSGHGSNAMVFNRLHLRKRMLDKGFIQKVVQDNGIDYILVETDKLPATVLELAAGPNEPKGSVLMQNATITLLGFHEVQ